MSIPVCVENFARVTHLSGSSRTETGVAQSTVGGGHGCTAGEVRGLLVAQQALGGVDQGGSVGATIGTDNGDGRFGVSSCNAMKHRLRQSIGMLHGGGADERITVEYTEVGAGSNIGVGTLLVEGRNPSLARVQ